MFSASSMFFFHLPWFPLLHGTGLVEGSLRSLKEEVNVYTTEYL